MAVPSRLCLDRMAIYGWPDGNIWFTERVGKKIGRLRLARLFLPLLVAG